MTLSVLHQCTSSGVERRRAADASEHIEQRSRGWRGVTHVVGGDQRDVEVSSDVDQHAVEPFLGGIEVALQVDVEAVGEETLEEVDSRELRVESPVRQRSIHATRQT